MLYAYAKHLGRIFRRVYRICFILLCHVCARFLLGNRKINSDKFGNTKPITIFASLKQISMKIKNGYQYTTSQIHISNVTVGDTVIHNNEMKTVSNTNIKRDSVMGTSIFGDTYHLGKNLVTKVNFVLKH